MSTSIRIRRATLLDVALFATQFRALVSAGIPVNQTLSMLASSLDRQSPAVAEGLRAIVADIEGGRTLAFAFRKHERLFGRLCVEMIATGETTGTLERNLADIADDCEARHRNRASLLSALIEPALIVIVGLSVCYLLLTVTVPQFKELYVALTAAGQLPLPTRVLIGLSDFLVSPSGILLLLGCLASVAAFAVAVTRSVRLRYRIHCLVLKTPLLGELALLDGVGRACRTLAIVYRSVGEIPLGIELAAASAGNMRISEAFDAVGRRVLDGRLVWESMQEVRLFPEIAVFMTRSGEESGRLDDLLLKVAETFETRVRYGKERLVTFLRYGLLMLMGGFVLNVLLAVYLPVFDLIDQLQK